MPVHSLSNHPCWVRWSAWGGLTGWVKCQAGVGLVDNWIVLRIDEHTTRVLPRQVIYSQGLEITDEDPANRPKPMVL